ncbi:hypothetical protein GQF61_04125 [Sphingobacterium sp. DK4209]|uniref:Core-binding (CB) domain-containing protein n=1 Tax=Sphingobacterium zhuxiongii TaxID=2662364 RepID=A0A5Q0Q7X8_9SPHI|nr:MULTISPECIES: phage integrase SAM-like domain-containing protein [unclassified Sphingobacterium]MVZ65026.1 hypothetical protein [Sphingobacterium sp. DK4209]QGA25364.1 hypothetical protein GFH32_03080 [Sphingobacterium sp. dk4302]
MATLKIIAHNTSQRSILVNFRITHKRKHRLINSKKYIDRDELVNGEVPLDFILSYLSDDYKLYKSRLDGISNIERLEIDEVKRIVEFGDQEDRRATIKETIDFCKFYSDRISSFNLKSDKREGNTISGYETAIKKLKEYFGEEILLKQLTTKSVKSWYNWMIDNQESPLRIDTARLYHSRVSKVYNDLMTSVNDPDRDYMPLLYNPFDSVKPSKERRKKRPLISLEEVRMIRDYQGENIGAGRSFFMLSLYMCGANYADIFDNCEKWLKNGVRAEYERRKTRNKRDDFAFISIKLLPEVVFYLKEFVWYKNIYKKKVKYYDRISLEVGYLERDLKLSVHIVPYTARYMFSNIASDQCDIQDDYISRAMNHKRPEFSETSGYLHNHWRKIDEAQQAVINKVNEDLITLETN